jgi:hypothetical protein
MISNLKGPGRYENKEKIYKPYSQTREITKSTLINTNNNDQTIFLENDLKISEKPDNIVYIYHSYDNENYSGRWYNFINKNILNNLNNNNTITFEIENYDGLGLHYMIIELTKKGIKEIQKIL